MVEPLPAEGSRSSQRSGTVFFSMATNPAQRAQARLMFESLRTFGGPLKDSTLWLFETPLVAGSNIGFSELAVECWPLEVPSAIEGYELSEKVCACSAAERLAGDDAAVSLAWVAPECLIFDAPTLFDLGPSHDVALRPVHIRNVGLPVNAPVDAFWERLYSEAGVEDVTSCVETFVEGQRIKPYFNSHSMSFRPSRGLCSRWLEIFTKLVADDGFQNGPCADDWHKIFLHQAVLSALVVSMIPEERIRLLPPSYSYPYHLHARVPLPRRAARLNDLVLLTREDRAVDPDKVTDIRIDEPLRSWLSARMR